MNRFKKAVCLLLMASMLTLTACNNDPEKIDDEESEQITTGRYVSEDILPEIKNGQITYFGTTSDGTLDLIYTTYDDSAMEELEWGDGDVAMAEGETGKVTEGEEPPESADAVEDDALAVDSADGDVPEKDPDNPDNPDGQMFTGGMLSEVKRMQSKDDGETWEEVPVEWSKSMEEHDVRNMAVAEDGTVYIMTEDYLYDETTMSENPSTSEIDAELALSSDDGDSSSSTDADADSSSEVSAPMTDGEMAAAEGSDGDVGMVVGAVPDSVIEFYKITPDNEVSTMSISVIDDLNQNGDNYYLDTFKTCGENRLFIAGNIYPEYDEQAETLDRSSDTQFNAIVDTTTGETVAEFEKVESGDSSGGYQPYLLFACNQEMVVSIDPASNVINAISTKDGSDMKDKAPKLENTNNISRISLDEEGNLYNMNYEYSVSRVAAGGSLEEKIVESSYLTFNSNAYIDKLNVVDDVIYMSGWNHLYRLKYDPDIVNDPSKIITVYTLYQSDSLRNAVVEMRKKDPDIIVKFESPEFQVIEDETDYYTQLEDALRILNTEMLAGKGPDIILFDNMEFESYADKGLLEDLSDLLSEGEYIDGVVNGYKNKDGTFVVPTRFTVPTLYGGKEIENIKTLEDLVEQIKSSPVPKAVYQSFGAREIKPVPENERPFLQVVTHYDIFSALYPVNAPAIFKDGNIDKDILKSFLESIKEIYDHNKMGDISEEDMMNYSGGGMGMSTMTGENDEKAISGFVNSMVYAMMNKQSKAGIDNYTGDSMSIMCENSSDEFYAVRLPGASENVFIPSDLIGISASSQKKELAKEFVQMMLSDEVQRYYVYSGMPVRKSAIEHQRQLYLDYLNEMEDNQDMKKPEFNFGYLLEGLETPSVINYNISQKISDASEEYCKGNITLDEAVNKIVSEMEIYVAERG